MDVQAGTRTTHARARAQSPTKLYSMSGTWLLMILGTTGMKSLISSILTDHGRAHVILHKTVSKHIGGVHAKANQRTKPLFCLSLVSSSIKCEAGFI